MDGPARAGWPRQRFNVTAAFASAIVYKRRQNVGFVMSSVGGVMLSDNIACSAAVHASEVLY